MPNPGWWEHVYDRVRGKEPMGSLPGMGMLTPPPGAAKEMAQPDSPYTPGKPLNALGARIMGIVDDPRNAWIGMGPVGMMARAPKAYKGVGEWWSVVKRGSPQEYSTYKDKATAEDWAKTMKDHFGHDTDIVEGIYTPPKVKIASVNDQDAAGIIGELAYKYPDSSNDELIRLGKKHHRVTLTKDQVARAMADMRKMSKDAWKEDNPDPDAILGRLPIKDELGQ